MQNSAWGTIMKTNFILWKEDINNLQFYQQNIDRFCKFGKHCQIPNTRQAKTVRQIKDSVFLH